MTVGTQLQQVISNVQSAAASIKTFALETEDGHAKNTFNEIADTLESAVNALKGRQQHIEVQEPQYRQQ